MACFIHVLENAPPQVTYNSTLMAYNVGLSFIATGITEPEVGMIEIIEDTPAGDYTVLDFSNPQDHIPETVTIRHVGESIWGDAYVQDVICYLNTVTASPVTANASAHVTATYTGRVRGIISITDSVSMINTPIYQSLELDMDTDGDLVADARTAIGADFQGTTTGVPVITRQVIQVKLYGRFTKDYIDDCCLIAGSVNEDNWLPPWNDPDAPGISEGIWIYDGIVRQAVDRATRRITMTHQFTRRADFPDQSRHYWYDVVDTRLSDVGELRRAYADTYSSAKIRFIAGTDTWWDGVTAIPTWTSVFLMGKLLRT